MDSPGLCTVKLIMRIHQLQLGMALHSFYPFVRCRNDGYWLRMIPCLSVRDMVTNPLPWGGRVVLCGVVGERKWLRRVKLCVWCTASVYEVVNINTLPPM